MNEYPNLFSPIKLGDVTLRNRIIQAPMGARDVTPEGYFTADTVAFFEAIAAGGAAVATLGESIVHAKTGVSRSPRVYVVSLDDPLMFLSLGKTARAIKRHGAVPSIELQHSGKFGGVGVSASDPQVAYGPSHEISSDGREIREMTEDLMLEIVEAFGEAAAKLKSLGFQMLTIHGGHGWLLHQFISPLDNRRKDKYGGSLENRARFPLMVIDAVRSAVGPGFPIEYRISGDEFRKGGYTLEEGVEFAKLIDGKVDLIHVSAAYHYVPPGELFVRIHPTYFLEDGCNVYLAAAVKKAVKTPVATVGGISDPGAMERIIASGLADVVAVARALIADHELPKKAAAGRVKEIRPCLRCLTCMVSDLSAGGRTYKCAVNPKVGREYEHKFLAPPPARRKKVIVAGGGPGGMQAAITASERGHQAILCEKSSSLGGQLKSVDNVPFKQHVVELRKHLEYLVRSSGAVVLLNTEATPEFVASQHPDALIAAVGAESIVPNIPGVRGKNVIMADEVRKPAVEIGQKVVILGGGLVGCEEAVYLAMQGKDVTVIEMLGDYARDANQFIKMALAVEFRNRKVKMTTNTKGKAIEAGGLLCTNTEGKEVLYEADTIVCAVGQKALTHVVDQLRGTVPEFYFIGDCEKPRKIMEAVTAGYDAAMDL